MSTTPDTDPREASYDDTRHHQPDAAPHAVATTDRRSMRRAVRLAVAAIALTAGVVAVQVARDASADEPTTVDCPQPAGSEACDGLWASVRSLDLPEHEWAAAAEAMGLYPRGEWISADGLRWEHLDGRAVVVANPRTADEPPPDGP